MFDDSAYGPLPRRRGSGNLFAHTLIAILGAARGTALVLAAITATAVSTGKTHAARVIGYDKAGDIALIQLQGASGPAGHGRQWLVQPPIAQMAARLRPRSPLR